ncbi:MAG: trigger factor [Patescibacteria group bacterium]
MLTSIMYTYSKKSLPKNAFEVIIDIKKALVKKEYESSFDKLLEGLEIEGFRKGKVPKKIGEKHIQKDDIYKDVIQSLIPRIYQEIIKKEDLKPIINPKIELTKAKEDEDWQIKLIVAVRPEVTLPDLKKIASDVKGETKKEDIWVPGKEAKNEADENVKERQKQKTLNALLESLLKKTKVEIPDLLIEAELEHRLSGLLDEIQKIGLTVDAYMKSKNTTMDELKARSKKEIEETYKVEFILNEIADKQNLQVEQEDLDKIFQNIKDDKEKAAAKQNSYYYASIIRKQKTLEYLLNL